jgi:cardiolipin synthase (CMP-forming)
MEVIPEIFDLVRTSAALQSSIMQAALSFHGRLKIVVTVTASTGNSVLRWRTGTAAAAARFTHSKVLTRHGARAAPAISRGLNGGTSATPRPPGNWNAANALTLTRIAAAPVAAHLILNDSCGPALLTVAAAGVTDAIDGWIARRYGLRTILGSYLDPLADKLLISCAGGALAAQGVLPMWLVAFVIGRDVMIVSFATVQRWKRTSGPWHRIFSASNLPPLVVQPLPISKLNTALQLVLMVSGIVHAGDYGLVSEGMLHVMCLATASTTLGSGTAYAYLHMRRAFPARWKA